MKRIYILTDGHEIFAVRAMTYVEWCQERKNAIHACGGNVNWESITPEMTVSPSSDLFNNQKFLRTA